MALILFALWALFHPIPAIAEPGTLSSDTGKWLLDARSVDPFHVEPRISTHSEPEIYAKSSKTTQNTGNSESRRAFVTGYNTLSGQTDDTPCIAAGGNICGRSDVVACPSDLPLHSWVRIDGREYECMDRTAAKHDGRFDISCDKDLECPYRLTGWRDVEVLR